MVVLMPVLIAQKNKNIYSTTRVYTEDGKLQMLIAYDPKCSCRTYTEYYHDGKVYAHRTFKVTEKGEYIDGDDVTYYPDGSIKIYKSWKNAIPDARAYSKYEDGQLEHEEFYTGKYKSGIWKYYNKKGELVKELVYEPGKTLWNSKKENYTAKYYSTGSVAYTEVYKDGKKISSTEKGSRVVVSKGTNIVDGKALFTLKCAACHAADKDGFGPALGGVTTKRNREWLYLMIRNGMKLVDQGDKDAVALYNTWRKIKHPNMEKLSNKQIQAIIDHLKTMK
jgi:antitoxin component YwqK of YwqJK toxin-antitoxin module/cytochrome c551/c552